MFGDAAVGSAYSAGTETLKRAGIVSAAAEMRTLLSELTGIPPLEIPLSRRQLTSDEAAYLKDLLDRRAGHEPLQYLLGKAYFYDLELEVAPAVLIPRPETELLVEWVLRELPPGGELLDLGTGSGAVAVAVARHRPDAKIAAADLSPEALAIAERNAGKNGVSAIRFVRSDLFFAFSGAAFDLIAANLPYVPERDRDGLDPEVRDHEPALALFAGADGFDLLERAGKEVAGFLRPGGKAIFELDPRQAGRMSALLAASGFACEVLRDLSGRERFVAGTLPCAPKRR